MLACFCEQSSDGNVGNFGYLHLSDHLPFVLSCKPYQDKWLLAINKQMKENRSGQRYQCYSQWSRLLW